MNKQILAWLVSKTYLACVIIGIIFLLEVENKVESTFMAIIGAVTIIIAFLVFRDRDLKIAFFVSGILLLNVAILNYWKEMTQAIRIICFVVLAIELVFILLMLYRNLGTRTSSRSMSYASKPSVSSNVLLNVSDFCKSKHAEKDKVDKCVSNLLTGGET